MSLEQLPIETLCLGCDEPGSTISFKPVKKQRRPLGEGDVLIDMKYCGVCHTDCVMARGLFSFLQGNVYDSGAFVPGHELASAPLSALASPSSRSATTSVLDAWSTPA